MSRRWESNSTTYRGRNRNNTYEDRNYQGRNKNNAYENRDYQRRDRDNAYENRDYQRRDNTYENKDYQRRNRDSQSSYHNRSFDNSRNNQNESWDKPHNSQPPLGVSSEENWEDPDSCNEPRTYVPEKRYNRSRSQLGGLVIYVHNEDVRRVIGKGGVKIKSLQAESNARIKIEQMPEMEKEPENVGKTAIRLLGTEEAQQRAKTLIEELVAPKSEFGDLHVLHGEEADRYMEQEREKWRAEMAKIDWKKIDEEYEEKERQRLAALPPIIKNFYKEDPDVANMPPWKVKEIRKNNNNITVERICDEKEGVVDTHIPNPIETFEQAFKDYPDILAEIKKQGFDKPSPIQCQAWPILLSGQDLIGIAQTGTGKTLAFLLPALIHIEGQVTPRDERPGPNVIILAPTRELALQIEKEVNKYSYHGIKAVCVYGGGNRREQINIVTKGVQIVIATPGRLNDLTQNNVLDVTGVTYLVIDEADRMLDMGFEPQIRKALIGIRPDRQTVMTSATWPEGVQRMVKLYMKNPIQVNVGSLDLAAVHSVTQKVFIVTEEEKSDLMYQFYREMDPEDKVIVFFGKKARVDHVASDMACMGIDCDSIHGDREQSDREQALELLKTGTIRILLSTDVASRGIDIEDITHVLNYDFPRDIEEYVHRVGRTGRAGRTGVSITYMTRSDWSHAEKLIKILEEAYQEVPEELYGMAERYKVWREKKGDQFRGRSRYGNRY